MIVLAILGPLSHLDHTRQLSKYPGIVPQPFSFQCPHSNLFGLLGLFDEEGWNIIGRLNPRTGQVEMFFIQFDADEFPVKFSTGHPGRAAAHKWIQNDLAGLGGISHIHPHQFNRFFCRVFGIQNIRDSMQLDGPTIIDEKCLAFVKKSGVFKVFHIPSIGCCRALVPDQ